MQPFGFRFVLRLPNKRQVAYLPIILFDKERTNV